MLPELAFRVPNSRFMELAFRVLNFQKRRVLKPRSDLRSGGRLAQLMRFEGGEALRFGTAFRKCVPNMRLGCVLGRIRSTQGYLFPVP